MDEFETVTLRDPSSALAATYVPVAGAVRHGQRPPRLAKRRYPTPRPA